MRNCVAPRVLDQHCWPAARTRAGSSSQIAFFGAFGGLLLCVSLFAQLGEGFSPIHARLTLTVMVVGIIAGMGAGFALVVRLGRHLHHLGVVIVGAGTVVLALTATGARTASTLDLAPGLSLVGVGAGASMGQLFDFILADVGMGRGRLRHRRARGGAAALQRGRRCRPEDDLLLRLRRASTDSRCSRSPPRRAWPRSPPRLRSSSACRCARERQTRHDRPL